MTLPDNDPLLEFYAEQYAEKTGVNITTARRTVDGKPNMQALLGRVDGDMTYAEACEVAGIPVPTDLPAGRQIVEPEPTVVPPIEVGPGDPAFDAGVDAAVEFVAAGLKRLELSPNDLVEASLERGYDLTGASPDCARFMAGLDAGYANLAGQAEPEVPEPIVEDEATDDPHPVRDTGGDEVPNDDESYGLDQDLAEAAPEPIAEVVDLRANTQIVLTYDARERTRIFLVAAGPCDPALVDRIKSHLKSGLWLIPEQVGLTNPRPADAVIDHHDHPFVSIDFRPTTAPAGQARSLAELADDIAAVPFWDTATFHPANKELAA